MFLINNILRFFPLPEDFLTVKETVKEFVPVDTDYVIHKLLVLLKFSWNVVQIEGLELHLSRTQYSLSSSVAL